MPNAFLPHSTLVKMAENAGKKLNGQRIQKGIIATGDSFMNNPEEIEQLKIKFPTIAAAEMEAASIAQTCYQFNKPFIIIRSISDMAGKDSAVPFKQFLEKAAENSAALVVDIIRQLDEYTFEREQQRIMEAMEYEGD